MNRDINCFEAEERLPKIRRVAPKPLTTAIIGNLKTGKTLADGAIRPGTGSLKIRKRATAGGVACEWLFEWSRGGKTARQTIGRYVSSEGPDGLTLAQARMEAARLQSLVRGGDSPMAHRDAQRHATQLRVESEKAAHQQAHEKTLAALLAAYVTNLRRKGKTDSAYDAENIFTNHINRPFPEIASLPAAKVQPKHFSTILARLVGDEVENKKGRTALKLRSYAAAAYKLALGAGIDPMAPEGVKEFGLTINPAAAVPATTMAAEFNRAGERTLSPDELRHYLCYILSLESELPRLTLLLQIVTCGQRFKQMLRITHADVNSQTLQLYDPKGNRLKPRLHVLPLLPEVQAVLDEIRLINPPSKKMGKKTPLFSSRGSIVSAESISNTVQQISDAMLNANLSHTPFQARDIRRTVETILGDTLQVSKDTRAQLLSHGISGVQAKHYDKGEHLTVKSQAMRLWIDYVANLCIGTHVSSADDKTLGDQHHIETL